MTAYFFTKYENRTDNLVRRKDLLINSNFFFIDDAVVIKGCVREAEGDIRKRNAVDHKDEEMPRKKKQDTNKTEYSNSCSTATKDIHKEQPSQQVVNNEPFRVC